MTVSFKVKIMFAMVLAVMVVLLASFELIRIRVASYFQETLRDQYAQQFQLAEERDAQRLAAYSNEVINNTSNPRLVAALYEKDFSRFYYDLAQELESFHRSLQEPYSSSRAWPFIRFIREDGLYLRPTESVVGSLEEATNALPGILSPFEEDQLEPLFSGIRTGDKETPKARSGYLVIERKEVPVLLKVFVCPIADAFGEFLGDLIMAIPWRNGETQKNGTLSVVAVDGDVFDSDGKARSQDWPNLVEALSGLDEQDGNQRVELAGSGYFVFSERLDMDARFPQAERAILFSTNEQERLLSGIRGIFLV
ncbi:MAG: hypothetical protein ACPGSB_07110, partial [Opitutales bacterium]